MLNQNDIPSIRDTMLSLADEYDQLRNFNTKLSNDCKEIQRYINNQVKQIKDLHEDFEKLRQAYVDKSGNVPLAIPPKNQLDLNHEFISNQNKEESIDSEINYEIKTLVPTEEIKHPLNIAIYANIDELTVVCCTSFSPDGSSIAIGSNKAIRVYNIDQDLFTFEQSLDRSESTDSNNHIRSISWTHDSKCVICGTQDSKIRIYQIQDGTLLKKIKIGAEGVFEIQVAKNNEYFAAVTGDGGLSLFSMTDYKHISTFDRDVENVIALTLSISEDSSLIAVGYSDYIVGLWNPKFGRLLLEKKCHDNGIFSVKFVPGKNNKLITSSLDATIKFWDIIYDSNDLPNLKLSNVLNGHENSVLSLSINTEGTWLLSGSKDTTVKLTDIEKAKMIYDIRAHKNSVITVSFSPRNKHFCTGSGDRSIKIWELL